MAYRSSCRGPMTCETGLLWTGVLQKNGSGGADEGSSFPCHCDRCDARRCPAGFRSVHQVVNKARNRKTAAKVKLYRLALAASMLALVVEALGAPRKW